MPPETTDDNDDDDCFAAVGRDGMNGPRSDGSDDNIIHDNGIDDDDDMKQYLFVIRHGDRWDYSHPSWKDLTTSRTGDSPLSSLGHQQARETGMFLDDWLSKRNFIANDVTWLSSPFLRCIQTSDDALNAFRFLDGTSIPILPEDSIFEWDGHNGTWHADLPSLIERKHYFPRLDLTYKGFFTPDLPEPRSSFFDRCQKAVQSFHGRYPYRPRQVFVMVTHAATCVALGKALTGLDLTEITPAGPCSIYLYTRNGNDNDDNVDKPVVWTADDHDIPGSMNGYTDHLTDMGTTTVPWNHFGDGTVKFYTGPPTSRFAPEK